MKPFRFDHYTGRQNVRAHQPRDPKCRGAQLASPIASSFSTLRQPWIPRSVSYSEYSVTMSTEIYTKKAYFSATVSENRISKRCGFMASSMDDVADDIAYLATFPQVATAHDLGLTERGWRKIIKIRPNSKAATLERIREVAELYRSRSGL